MTVESTWISPAEAMRLREEGLFEMIMPTVANLRPLLDLVTVDEVMEWADTLVDIPEILPAIVPQQEGPPVVLMPWDDGYGAALDSPPAEGSTM